MKSILLFTCLILYGSLKAQDRPAPSYLIKQDFPDSVRATRFTNPDGEQVLFKDLLSQYKGKKVVIDFWASWCKDCILGFPDLNELIVKSRKSEVVFLFLSVDKEEQKWKSAIARFNIPGEHYRFELGWKNPLSNYIDLDWIPRYLVLDENGRVIEPKTITAGDKRLSKAL